MTASTYVFLAGLGMILSAGTAYAQQTLYVAGYGGSFELGMRQDTLPEFEKKHNVKIEYVAGNSTDTLAKLQAQKGNQKIDVILVDDGPMYRAIALGFCAPIKNLSTLDLHEAARFKEDKAVGVGIVAAGLMYNTRYFQEKGWLPPTSWSDLVNPKYRNLLVIPPINNTYGVYTLSMLARLDGGSESNIEPGFKAMKDKVNPNVLVYEPSPGKMTELFQSGQAVIAVWGSGRVASFAATGFPVDFVYPKEGAATLLIATCPVAKPNMSLLAQEFIEMLLAPKFQKEFSETYGYGPVSKQVAVDTAKLGMAPIGERATKLAKMNWDAINENIDLWTKRWNREVER